MSRVYYYAAIMRDGAKRSVGYLSSEDVPYDEPMKEAQCRRLGAVQMERTEVEFSSEGDQLRGLRAAMLHFLTGQAEWGYQRLDARDELARAHTSLLDENATRVISVVRTELDA